MDKDENKYIKSKSFEAPFVRVRGRLSRKNSVKWSPCLRTFRQPKWVYEKKHDKDLPASDATQKISHSTKDSISSSEKMSHDNTVELLAAQGYWIAFENAQNSVLAKAPVNINFFATDREWALFTQRLPYHKDTSRVVLRYGWKVLSEFIVPKHIPEFELLSPLTVDEIDTEGILHLKWLFSTSEKENIKKDKLIFFVRYSADNKKWHRPGVNISGNSFDIDLRQMPGGDHCVAEVIATNGYETSYVETPIFKVPRKRPEIICSFSNGPVLFAQGYSHEDGPLLDKAIEWILDGSKKVAIGSSFDARLAGKRIYDISVKVTDSFGLSAIQYLGRFNGETGLRIGPLPGL